MTTVLKVLRFDSQRMHSDCEVVSTDVSTFYVGQRILVDLTVNGGFGDTPESELVGKVVEVNRFHPYEYLGIGVKLFGDASNKVSA